MERETLRTPPIGATERSPAPNKSRHVSIRVPDELFQRLDTVAAERGETVSQCARRLLGEGLTTPGAPATVVDDAIATLLGVRGLLAETGPSREPAPTTRVPESPPPELVRSEVLRSEVARPEVVREPPKTVNIHNAKTNLSRLLADVGRGNEIVIAHGGRARARLVPVDEADGGPVSHLD